MKSRMLVALVVTGALAAPAVAHADAQVLSRAQVRAELAGLRAAGYDPSRGEDASYPTDILAAEARIAAQRDAGANAASYGGGNPAGASEAGARKAVRRLDHDSLTP
ncbi:hypothetical protein WT67_12905 [Burkholderia stagnalis]|uniref:DUF4148 domain-containing protein n=1 Tax=Burkholderia stagnalis TaxID=1503054 RepID=A0A6L3N0Y4_9BURK|nr:DUF4148 domain-containing protein [Burkholderia stagnalis]KAB0639304.1 DUF4148 domain-containing protein [Burkholderia stagnalis]KVO46242.1 hypothetical protein WT17_08515 [Burkholderia stagnalis]KVO76202.1 hypothetical protein WT19_09525 [Burkholderia stagnalis]KVW53918.1 hypothetical protein WT28_32075 [Burkholderia stagnalis]KVW70428.1 hypothetical protein WT29_34015 [Burkholderia stagnalis]